MPSVTESESGVSHRVIVGLGNPGIRYAQTRHNVGFMVLDRLGEYYRVPLSTSRFQGLLASVIDETGRVTLLKPLTYVNRSGESVASLCRYYQIPENALLIVVDDVSLPVGKIRLRGQGSSGGHHGLESIIVHLKSDAFARLRIGVGSPIHEVPLADYVLASFPEEQKIEVAESVAKAVQAVVTWLREGLPSAMNTFNGK